MSTVSGKAFDFSILTRVFSYVSPYKKLFYFSVLLTVLSAVIAPLRPYLVQQTLDNYIAFSDTSGLEKMILFLIAVMLFHALVEYFETYLTNLLGQNVVRDLRVKLFKKIIGFRLGYFDRTPIGTLQTRAISDMETIGDIFSEGLIVILGDILQLVVVVIVMLYTDWRLTLFSLSTIPILLIATNIFKNGIKKTFHEVRTEVAALNTFVQEHITGMSVVQVFNREEAELKKFIEINSRHADANIRSVWYYSVFFPVVEILSATSLGLLIWWGMKGVVAGNTTFGSMVAFIMYINMVFRPIRELADKFNTLQMGMVSSERIFKVLDTDDHIENSGKLVPDEAGKQKLRGELLFESVYFAYTDSNWVLKNLSFTIQQGKMLALVGTTGSGKTSVANLVSRFYEFQKGRISIDGTDIREFELFSLRKNIAFVLQDVFLFSDTIFNNITLRNPDISKAEVEIAAKSIGADRFIDKLPGGYDYNVQERGATLSAGQRQLISFIRAYVHQPSILILDEATSSIDTETEILVQQATEILTRNRTSLVIAHRLATIQKADRILVLDHGEVKESGTHQELLNINGYYKKLYDIQFRNNA